MIKINTKRQLKDNKIKIRKKGNSYEARKTIDLSKIYGFEVKKRISKTALTEEEAIALLKSREQEELINAAEQVKTNGVTNKLEYDKLDKAISNVGQDFSLKIFVNKMLQEKKLQSEINLYSRRRKVSPKTVTS